MKILAKPIDVLARFDVEGIPTPIKIKLEDEDQAERVIKIEYILFREKLRYEKSFIWSIRCRGIINDVIKDFEIRYCCPTTTWTLYRI
ncbi:hypothetical protein [Anaerosolibacter sp.]|uniref:hypothetical protein n=1 Tax=Anaerosolibacter sp. TaxID=1872527 RepID=UPI0039F08EAF